MKKFVSIGWKASTSIKEIFVDLIIYLNANNVNICPRAKIPEIYYLFIVPIATESNFFSRTVSLTVYLVGVWACDKKRQQLYLLLKDEGRSRPFSEIKRRIPYCSFSSWSIDHEMSIRLNSMVFKAVFQYLKGCDVLCQHFHQKLFKSIEILKIDFIFQIKNKRRQRHS